MKKAIIFDFDGTIADTMDQNYEAWKYSLSKFNFEIDKNTYFKTEGATPSSIASLYSKEEEIIKVIISEKEEYFLKNYQVKIYENCLDFLEKMKKNYRLALVTGGKKIRVNKILSNANIINYFDVIVTADDVIKGKPNKEPYVKALELLNLKSKECFVIENAPYGIESALSAEIFTIALETTLKKEELKNANLVVKDYDELMKLNIFK